MIARTLNQRVGTVDFPPEWRETIDRVRDNTLVSDERMGGLIGAIEYVTQANIPGAIVECGVWRGGSSMAAALTLRRFGEMRPIYLFDTFEGAPPPGDEDVDFRGDREVQAWDTTAAAAGGIPIEAVEEAMRSTGYPMEHIRLVKGLVEDTVPRQAPQSIAVLRLDTDWYKSTRHELEHLYPRLAVGGVLIIDDYGHFEGARQAVDEYFAENPLLLARLDYSGRIAVKR